MASPHHKVPESWLALAQEDVLAPGHPIFDCPHHLWDRPGDQHRSVGLMDYVGASHNLRASHFVQCRMSYATVLSGIREDIAGMLENANASRLKALLIIQVVFAILGCFTEGLGTIAIILPVIFPALMALGVISFGVAPSTDELKVEDVIMGTLPFFTIIVSFIHLLIAELQIALWRSSAAAVTNLANVRYGPFMQFAATLRRQGLGRGPTFH